MSCITICCVRFQYIWYMLRIRTTIYCVYYLYYILYIVYITFTHSIIFFSEHSCKYFSLFLVLFVLIHKSLETFMYQGIPPLLTYCCHTKKSYKIVRIIFRCALQVHSVLISYYSHFILFYYELYYNPLLLLTILEVYIIFNIYIPYDSVKPLCLLNILGFSNTICNKLFPVIPPNITKNSLFPSVLVCFISSTLNHKDLSSAFPSIF